MFVCRWAQGPTIQRPTNISRRQQKILERHAFVEVCTRHNLQEADKEEHKTQKSKIYLHKHVIGTDHGEKMFEGGVLHEDGLTESCLETLNVYSIFKVENLCEVVGGGIVTNFIPCVNKSNSMQLGTVKTKILETWNIHHVISTLCY